MRKLLIVIFVFLSAPVIGNTIELTPVANLSLLGGQNYLDSDPSSFTGNGSLYYSPVLHFSKTKALVPVFNIDYRGTSDVDELVGGGTLTRETIVYGATVKYIFKIKDIKSKLRTSWKDSLINEAENEDWGEGLFDYTRLLIGGSLEKEMYKHNFAISFDYYNVKFPNYNSLIYEEEFETSIDTETYTEISNNAGEDVLDYKNISIGLKASKAYSKRTNVFYSYNLDLRSYGDQTIVDDDGSFLSDKRKDTIHTLSAGIGYIVKRTELSLSNDTVINRSNQNSFDANTAKFIDNYYAYWATEFMPSVSFYFGNGELLSRLRFWWSIEHRKYNGRLAQDNKANYLDDKVWQRDNSFGISYIYPLTKNISISLQTNIRTSSSNMKYESNYKYNYNVTNYLLGFNQQF